jgi:hypothetical protein
LKQERHIGRITGKYIIWAVHLHITGGGEGMAGLPAKYVNYNYSGYYEVRIVLLR